MSGETYKHALDSSVAWRRRSDGFIGKVHSISSENEPGRPVAIEPLDRRSVIYLSDDDFAAGWTRVALRGCPRCKTQQWAEVGGHFIGHGCAALVVEEEKLLRRRLAAAGGALTTYRNKQFRRHKAGQVFDACLSG